MKSPPMRTRAWGGLWHVRAFCENLREIDVIRGEFLASSRTFVPQRNMFRSRTCIKAIRQLASAGGGGSFRPIFL